MIMSPVVFVVSIEQNLLNESHTSNRSKVQSEEFCK